MLLLAGFLGGALVLVPTLLGRKKGDVSGPVLGGGAKNPSDAELPPSPTGFGETLTLGQKYDALISRFGGDLTSTKADLDSTRKELETLRATLQSERTSQDKDRKDLGDTLQKLRDGIAREASQGREPSASTPVGVDRPLIPPSGALRAIDLSPSTAKDKKEKRSVRIPTASGGQATLLNGVFAPVSGEPSPVRLRFDSAILGPQKARLALRDSFLIGKATGDPNGCRVSIQIEKFSTVKDGGEAIETKALGFVVGDDGLEGVPGSYEWRAKEFLPLAVGVGGLQGLSGALAQSQTTSTLNPLGGATNVLTGDSMKFAGYQAMGGASGKLGDIIAERMKEIHPAVSTPANRKVTVVFLDGITLDGLDPKEIDDDPETNPFRGLDAHR
ncbi:MAG TPA: TraB/VirB10 family protein [Planctomycetota bacterium]|nr:TraB/VirB10 family protein [Planctomycetota bacterium]